MARRVDAVLVGVMLLALIHLGSTISLVRAKPEGGIATFVAVTFPQTKIYEGENATLLFTISNRNSSETQFYIRVNSNEQMVYDGKPDSFSCAEGQTSPEMSVTLSGWTGPETYRITVELHSSPSDTLQDVRQLSLTVVKLIAGQLTSSPSKIVWGLSDTSPLTVNFTNTGNDDMRDTVVTVMSSGLRISPLSSGNLGTVSIGQTKTLTFTLSALNSRETKPGLYKFNLRISFNDFRSASHHQDWTIDLNLEKMKPRILFSYSPPNPKYSDAIKFKAELVDEKKNPLVGERITFSAGSTTSSNETSASGAATYDLPKGFDSGNHSVRLSYGGSEYYMNASEIFLVEVSPLATSLLVHSQKIINATIPTTINLSLVDERLRPVPSQTLKLTMIAGSSNLSQVGQTDNEGRAIFSLSLNTSGDAQLGATFAGSTNYLGSSNTSIIKVSPASTRVTVRSNPSIMIFDNTVDLEVFLRDLLNRPLRNASLTVLVDSEPVATLSTDPEGHAKTELTMQPAAFFKITKIRVVFDGDDKSAQYIGETEVVAINPAALGVLGAVVAGGIASSLLLVIRWRRLARKQAPPSKIKPVRPQKTELPVTPPLSPLDERVYKYIVERSGVISLGQASQDLGITMEQLRVSTQRLRDAGRLAPSSGE